MDRNNIIRRQLLINALFNLIAFTMILIAFGFIVFNQVRSSLFTKLDDELISSKQMLQRLVTNRDFAQGTRPAPEEAPMDGNVVINIRSPRVIPLLRNASGDIINFGSVNNTYYEQYLKDIPFDRAALNAIVSIQIENLYYFRSLTVPVKTEKWGEIYLQLLINADSERNLLHNMSFIIVISIAAFTALSVLASYILSRRTMLPVRAAWNRQSEFVENVSHELRTPLTVIQNSLEILLTKPEQKIIENSETLGLLLNETARLSKLVADMLTLARSDGTMTELNKALFSLDVLLRAVCEPFQELAESQGKTFQLHLNCLANIYADKNRIHQLIVILLDNALKYTDQNDKIAVATQLQDNRACLTVADTGIGISDDAINRVFDRFYREDKARAHERSGSGLGLSIASWIVKKHGGNIKAGHNEPRGAVITVKIPKS